MLKLDNSLISGRQLEREAIRAVEQLLASIPAASVTSASSKGPDRGWDFEVNVKTPAGSTRLVCEAKSRAWPSELYAIAERLRRAKSRSTEQVVPVIVAPYVSSHSAETCREIGLSWADLSGNGELRIEGAFIHIEGRANEHKKGRGTASLYSPKSAQIVHALLLDPNRKWTTAELAAASKTSLGQVSSVRELLRANAWIRSAYGWTVLEEPRKVLDDWSAHYKPKRLVTRYFTLDTPAELEAKIGASLKDYALTEFSGAERYAPYTRQQRVAFYISMWSAIQAKALGLKEGDGASNVTVYETDGHLFTENVGGVVCASPIQVYLDLRLLPGRSQDAADHLLTTVIEPRWR